MTESVKRFLTLPNLRKVFIVGCFLYAIAAVPVYIRDVQESRDKNYLTIDGIIVEVGGDILREKDGSGQPGAINAEPVKAALKKVAEVENEIALEKTETGSREVSARLAEEKQKILKEAAGIVKANVSTEKLNAHLQNIFDGKLVSYQAKILQFYTTIFLTLIFCILGIIVLLLPDGEIAVPLFPEIKIPTYIFYLVIPTCLCYGWIQFGFYLHHLIEARLTLMNLIHAQVALGHPADWCLGNDRLVTYSGECYKYYYSLTRANDLKDTGFLDSWFLSFLPPWFPTDEMGMAIVVPWATLGAIGILYGISHGFQLGMIFNWMSRFAPRFKPNVIIVPIVLLTVVTFFFVTSHPAFYSSKNRNWVQIIILIVTAFVFKWITSISVRDYYKIKAASVRRKRIGKKPAGEKTLSRHPQK